MVFLALVAVFGYVVRSGPAFDEHRAAHQTRRDFPGARVARTAGCASCGRATCSA